MAKKFWRCTVCNDTHYGIKGPEICPTCSVKNAYVEIHKNEFNNVVFGIVKKENLFKEADMLRIWEAFSKENDFKLNPDKKIVSMVAKGVLGNELESGLKMCPCRISDGERENDLKLICPCNFKIHDTWTKNGRCWCNLFVKK
jgi:ferredoxin-thioredoxin reductase catalytic subunit